MFFLLLGNLFSWFALKQQQTVVNSPACFKCAFLLDNLCLAEVPLLCYPSTRDGQRLSPDGLQAVRIRHALPKPPSLVKYSGTAPLPRDRHCRSGTGWDLLQVSWDLAWVPARGIQVKWTCIIVPFKKRIIPLSSYEVILSSLQETWNVSV